MAIRILSAAALIALLVVIVWWLPPSGVMLLSVIAAALGGLELAGLAASAGAPVPGWALSLLSALVCLGGSYPGAIGFDRMFVLVILAATVLTTFGGGAPDRTTLTRAAFLLGGPLYLGVSLAYLLRLFADFGPQGLSALAVMVIASDSAQYFTGRALGRRKLAPLISPAKTIEGALGGVIASAATGAWLINWARPQATIDATVIEGAAVGLAVAIAGMLGDLFESALKRGAGVKDSANLIPGHGGVLDRIDSWLIAGPVFYLFLRYLG